MIFHRNLSDRNQVIDRGDRRTVTGLHSRRRQPRKGRTRLWARARPQQQPCPASARAHERCNIIANTKNDKKEIWETAENITKSIKR